MAGACGNRTHPAGFWPATLDLKSRRDTRTLCAPMLEITRYSSSFIPTPQRRMHYVCNSANRAGAGLSVPAPGGGCSGCPKRLSEMACLTLPLLKRRFARNASKSWNGEDGSFEPKLVGSNKSEGRRCFRWAIISTEISSYIAARYWGIPRVVWRGRLEIVEDLPARLPVDCFARVWHNLVTFVAPYFGAGQ